MYSDSMHEAYMSIYNGIRHYRDYCKCQRKHTIETLYHINLIMMAFSQKNASSELSEQIKRECRYFAVRDFERAFRDESYDSDEAEDTEDL